MTEQDGANRSRQEGRPENSQCHHERERIVGGKNDLGENWCQRQVDHEVEPHDDLTNGAQNYRSLSSRILGGINDAAIALEHFARIATHQTRDAKKF